MQDRETYREYLALKADLAALQFLVALVKRPWIGRKFNVNQPRVPRGNENGGQWTDGSDWGAPSEAVVREGQDTPPGFVRISDRPHVGPPIDIHPDRPKPGIGHNQPPVETTPEIPELEPSSKGTKLRLARQVAYWITAAAPSLRRSLPGLVLLAAIEGITWFATKYYPYVEAYLDPPKSLKELQDAVSTPRIGTEEHHIVEKTQARREGYPESMIESPENKVRISTFKHWLITAFYQNKAGGISPRKDLIGKTWEEKRAYGLEVLKAIGVYNGK